MMAKQYSEEDLKRLQQLVPNASLDQLRTFLNCVTEKRSFVYSPLFSGILVGTVTNLLCRKQNLLVRSVLTVFSSVIGFGYSKMQRVGQCKMQTFGWQNIPFAEDNKSIQKIDQLDQQDSIWDEFDTNPNDMISQLEDAEPAFEDNLTTEEPKIEKKHTTYDQLWEEHRKSLFRVEDEEIDKKQGTGLV